jgi:hypothetical protein
MTDTLFKEETALAKVPVTPPMQPMEMIQAAFQSAIANGAGLEVVDRILKQQKEMMEYNDRLAFNQALARVQANAKVVQTNRKNTSTGSRYADFGALDKMLRPLYIAEGLALSYGTAEIDKPETVRVTCTVSLGAYSRTEHIDMPADGKGAKGGDVMTKTHATGSAVMYGRRYLLNMIFNLTQEDDDGNAAAGLDLKIFAPLLEAIENAPTLGAVDGAYLRALELAKTQGEKDQFKAARVARKAALK